ncbi:MAG: hypothetical protein HY350_03365, partial [Candidatus Omnitrophica bacterium]|nr:hypothetical protein [Candidatus Omnitrophota bacterium]
MIRAVTIIVLISICAIGAMAEEAKKDGLCIYYGDQKTFKKAAVIEVNKILEVHPACKKIKEKKLDSADVEYWLLMNEFNDNLRKILPKIAREGGYDLVLEKDSVPLLLECSKSDSPAKVSSSVAEVEMPDLTQQVIDE